MPCERHAYEESVDDDGSQNRDKTQGWRRSVPCGRRAGFTKKVAYDELREVNARESFREEPGRETVVIRNFSVLVFA